MPRSPPDLKNAWIVLLNILRRLARAHPTLAMLIEFRLSARWHQERGDHDLQQKLPAPVRSELTLHRALQLKTETGWWNRVSTRLHIHFLPFCAFCCQMQVWTTCKWFLNVMVSAPLNVTEAHNFSLSSIKICISKKISFLWGGLSQGWKYKKKDYYRYYYFRGASISSKCCWGCPEQGTKCSNLESCVELATPLHLYAVRR